MTAGKTSIEMLAHGDHFMTVRKGETILREGSRGEHMYVIRSGRVALSFEGVPLATLEAGDILGELAMLEHDDRTATAVAIEDCELVPIDRKRFLYLVQQTPNFALDVMRVMAQRLRQTNQLLAARNRGD